MVRAWLLLFDGCGSRFIVQDGSNLTALIECDSAERFTYTHPLLL